MNANDLASLIPLVLLLAFAYLVLIRPARRRAQDVHAVQSALSAGDEVMLSSGIFGTVTSIEDDRVRLQLAPGVEVAVARAAVAKILRDEPAAPEYDEEAATSETESTGDDDTAHPDNGESRGAH